MAAARLDNGPFMLSVSSCVTYGTVGNAATTPGLAACGCRALAVPSVVLSNHPGFGKPGGLQIDAERLRAILDKLGSLGCLARCAGVVTGYFASPEQVTVVAETITAMKASNPALFYLCDPIVGDDHTGLYVPEPVAEAIRDRLLPLAGLIAPNRFELEWLARTTVSSVETAGAAAASLAPQLALVTSLPAGQECLQTALVGSGISIAITTVRRSGVPHGTGDLLSGLIAGQIGTGCTPDVALARAMAMLERVLDASTGKPVLDLAPLSGPVDWPEPLPLDDRR